jgi:hypothetical protein
MFGDFNAKHVDWRCKVNNVSGNHIVTWLKETENKMSAPKKPASHRSGTIIDLCLTHDAIGWQSKVINGEIFSTSSSI